MTSAAVTPGFSVFVAVNAAGLASMIPYALAGRRRDADVDGKRGQFLGGFGDFILHWFMWALAPVVAVSRRLGLTPDFYNYLGLGLGLASGPLIATGHLEWAGWAIVLSGIADVLDGRIARMAGVASDYGDFIDSTFDRFAEASTFLGFAYALRDVRHGPLVAAAALAGSLIVSYARARGEVLGVHCSGGLMQRAERLVLTALVCLVGPTVSGIFGLSGSALMMGMLWLMAVTTLLTAVWRTLWIAARLRGR
jgi:CDP-diacylglycerol--glycerol-3-phosphate 3-phosphatidyltransferase